MSAILATLAELKTYIKKTGTDKDTFLQALLDNGEKHIETLINRKIATTAYKELYSGDGSKELYLDNYPIITLSKLSTDIDHTNLNYTADITLNTVMINKEEGKIESLDNSFYNGYRNIYIEYTAGYADDTTVPKDLKQVLIEMAAAKFFTADEKRTGITAKNVMSENINFQFVDLNNNQLKVIERHKKPPSLMGLTAEGFTEV